MKNNREAPFGVFNRTVLFYKARRKNPCHTVRVGSWWDVKILWQQLDFRDLTQGTIYRDFEAELTPEKLRELMDHFSEASRKPGQIYAHSEWQNHITNELAELEEGLEERHLGKIVIKLAET
jgi:hypothetical protein